MSSLLKRFRKECLISIVLMSIFTGCSKTGNENPNANGIGLVNENTEKAVNQTQKNEWKLIWSDEFDGENGDSVNPEKWVIEVGNNNGWGNNELQYYTGNLDNLSIQDGSLVIKALKKEMEGFGYTSSRIKTKGKFSFKYGKVEMRAKLPYGQGIWPAFWMLGTDIDTTPWPDCGEIDIMEFIGRCPDAIYGTIHGPEYYGAMGIQGSIEHGVDIRNDFHTYGVEWNSESIRWFFDDMLYHTILKENMPTTYTWAYDREFFILLNLAVGGLWPQNPDDTTQFPQSYVIDYVRVHQRGR